MTTHLDTLMPEHPRSEEPKRVYLWQPVDELDIDNPEVPEMLRNYILDRRRRGIPAAGAPTLEQYEADHPKPTGRPRKKKKS